MADLLPKVLAGPIVRRVEKLSCSFWVALSQEATITARIWKGERTAPVTDADTPAGSGQLKTRPVAAKLHIAVVTIDLTGGHPLDPGVLYAYDLMFVFADTTKSDLQGELLLQDEKAEHRLPGVNPGAPLHKALGFTNNRLPTFLAPPDTVVGPTPADGLRMAHVSCRRAGAASFDSLPGITALVDHRAATPEQRPHSLFLTGDQVYADDITTTLMPLLIGLGADLLGDPQLLPGFPPDPRTGGDGLEPITGAGLPGNLANLPPMRRKWLLWQLAGFTGSDTENHAITFAEFVALHLVAWSPRVWRKIPAFADVFKAPAIAGGAAAPDPAIIPWLNRPWFCSAADPSVPEDTVKKDWADPAVNVHAFTGFNSSAHDLNRYAGGTPLVAQLLANTPTYMIFDDHEIADDWNLNGRWSTRVYARPWGRFVVRNGLMAYALMQGWGNDPVEFGTVAQTGADNPGKKLLDAIPSVVTGSSATDIDILLGFDSVNATQPKRTAFHYSLKTDDYQVTVLDTRTHRAVNNTSLDSPNLIDNLDQQLPAPEATATQNLHVVVSAAPVFSPVVIEQFGQPAAQLTIDGINAHHIGEVPGFTPGDETDPRRSAGCGQRGERGGEKFDREGWSANEAGFEALIARLASHRSVVLLSGDIHYASTMTLDYWAKDSTAPARLVQCIASPAKNVFKDVVDQILRRVGNLQRAEEIPMERLAWKDGVDVSLLVPAGARVSLARRSRLRHKPALVPTSPWPTGAAIPAAADKAPDWRWRIQTVTDTVTKRDDLPPGLRTRKFLDHIEQQPLADQLVEISSVHQGRLTDNLPLLRRMVFAPNFGIVRFERTATGNDVVHRLFSPASTKPSTPAEAQPLPDALPQDPTVLFGPHTVHRAALTTPQTQSPPVIHPGPANG